MTGFFLQRTFLLTNSRGGRCGIHGRRGRRLGPSASARWLRGTKRELRSPQRRACDHLLHRYCQHAPPAPRPSGRHGAEQGRSAPSTELGVSGVRRHRWRPRTAVAGLLGQRRDQRGVATECATRRRSAVDHEIQSMLVRWVEGVHTPCSTQSRMRRRFNKWKHRESKVLRRPWANITFDTTPLTMAKMGLIGYITTNHTSHASAAWQLQATKITSRTICRPAALCGTNLANPRPRTTQFFCE